LEEIRARRAALQQQQQQQQQLDTTGSHPPPVATSVAVTSRPAASSSRALAPATNATATASRSRGDHNPDTTTTTALIADLRQQLQEQAAQEKNRRTDEATQWQAQVTTLQAAQTTSQALVQDLQTQLGHLQTQRDQLVQEQSSTSRNTPTAATTATPLPPHVQDEINALHRAQAEAADASATARQQTLQLQSALAAAQEQHATDSAELVQLRTLVRTAQQQSQQQPATTTTTTTESPQSYKEKAKRQAEQAAHQRAVQAWEEEKMDLEGSLEELTLDKEQLLEENQGLYDRLEEMKLDVDTATMEAEEVRLELADAREANREPSGVSGGDGDNPDQEEKMEVLMYQNSRLREALIRLREQSSLEKMALQKDLRQAETQAQKVEEMTAQVVQHKQARFRLEEEANELKDMVEQGAAFESMVEDLSDRVLSFEEDITALQTIVREMEEAAELSAEVEEVQTEEIKALWRDVEGRDTIIRNREEAIKMQRRHEEDSIRTVKNYRTTVETLKQEKEALMQVQQGAFGEKSDWMAASQKALARAAQLVTDAANLRKEKAHAATKAMEHIVYKHLSKRLEGLTPSSVVAPEVAAMKGELYACKVAGKASQSLEGIVESFSKKIRPALPPDETGEAEGTGTAIEMSDDARQEVTTMLHQVEMAQVLVAASSDLRRFIAGGQWPDLVAPEVSVEVGAILGHSVTELDSMLGGVFHSLKEEGALTPDQSNLGALRQMVENTAQRIGAEVDREDATLISHAWSPPGWKLLRDASIAKFCCLGAAASLSIVQADGDHQARVLVRLYNRVEQASNQASNICFRLTNLDVQNSVLVKELEESVDTWKKESTDLVNSVRTLLFATDGSVESCSTGVENVLKEIAKLLQTLRSAKLNPADDESFHALSPEANDPWEKMSVLVQSIRAIDGDHEDINYLIRARDIERHLEQAIDNEPKLEQAEAKVSALEKNLSSRSKEIAMQNARLSELEKVVAKSSTGSMGRGMSSEAKSVEEYNSLREENRVLTEAMDVVQRQVDEYENEIRALKDFKSPKRAGATRGTPRRSMTSIGDFGSPGVRSAVEEKQTSTGMLEATVFRPALQQALEESARWKTSAAMSLLDLPPLSVAEESKMADEATYDLYQLSTAIADYRLELSSIKLVDLTSKDKTPREQLRENKQRSRAVTMNLESVLHRCRGRIV
jgi:hypothetical protein